MSFADHQIILTMIENVNPSDTAKLDDLDIAAWNYVYPNDPRPETWYKEIPSEKPARKLPPLEFTRSRDALKAIRPEGWRPAYDFMIRGCIGDQEGKFQCCLANIEKDGCLYSEPLPTEYLAELHVIIQAIAYERSLNEME